MKRQTLYIIIPVLVLALFFTLSGLCKGEDSAGERAKDAVEEVGKSVKKATDEAADILDGENKQENVSVAEDKEESGSSQSEDVQNLAPEEKTGTITFNGKIDCTNEVSGTEWTPITITIDWDKKSVGGEATLLWYEYIEIAEEGGESHHSHRYACRIEVKGPVMGSIDKNDNIDATISGNSFCDYGYDPESAEYSAEICELCSERFNNKFYTFKLTGKFSKIKNASISQRVEGSVVEKGWKWEATR